VNATSDLNLKYPIKFVNMSNPLRVFVTGFGKFNGVDENPSEILVRNLETFFNRLYPDQPSVKIVGTSIVDVSIEGVASFFESVKQYDGKVDLYLHLGVTSASYFSLELQGINNSSFRVPDQRGNQPVDVCIDNGDPLNCRRNTTVCCSNIVFSLQQSSHPVVVSDDAGRFLCNFIYYASLVHCEALQDKGVHPSATSLFFHIPTFQHVPHEHQERVVSQLLVELGAAFVSGNGSFLVCGPVHTPETSIASLAAKAASQRSLESLLQAEPVSFYDGKDSSFAASPSSVPITLEEPSSQQMDLDNAPKPFEQPVVPEDPVTTLMAFGFSRADSENALNQTNGDVNMAADILLQQEEDPFSAAATSSSSSMAQVPSSDLSPEYLESIRRSQLVFQSIQVPPETSAETVVEDEEEWKMVILCRTDIAMTAGKIAAQCSHAALKAHRHYSKDERLRRGLLRWESMGEPIVCLKVDSYDQLESLCADASSKSIPVSRIRDAGRTQVEPGTVTVAALGPHAKSKIDSVTGKLRLL
jgi:peptidyl-tRNA hydrolase